jgi:hypothetical protein
MLSRQSLLALSIIFSVLVHGVFLAVASRVSVSGIRPESITPSPARFLVHFRQEATKPSTATPAESPEISRKGTLSTGPGKIADMLKRDNDAITPAETALGKMTEIPQLSERVATEVIERDYALSPDPSLMETVDAKIVEISQDTAREGIEVPRRIVTPSVDRIVPEGETPVLRGPSNFEAAPVASFAPAETSALAEAAQPPGTGLQNQEGAPIPPYENNVVLPEHEAPDEPELPKLQEIARASVVEQVRAENTYDFMDSLLEVKLETFVPPNEKEGFFRLQLVPKKGQELKPIPKDVTFVIDASNSIIQRKLDSTVKASKSMFSQLRPEDRFNVVIFRDSPSFFQPEPVSGTPENKAAAAQFINGIKSGGQTDVFNALRQVIQKPPRAGIPGVVVVMSDGRPTIGLRDTRELINQISEENTTGNTVFAYGAGNTVNGYLLDLLAYRNRGEARVLPSADNMAKDLPDFFSRLNDPLLAALHANYGRLSENDSIVPKDMPDFYKGRSVAVYGKFNPAKDNEFFMRLVGASESNKKEVIFKADLRKASTGDEKIARNWAFERIYYLIDEICRIGDKPELLNEIKQLSAKYNIRTIYSE